MQEAFVKLVGQPFQLVPPNPTQPALTLVSPYTPTTIASHDHRSVFFANPSFEPLATTPPASLENHNKHHSGQLHMDGE